MDNDQITLRRLSQDDTDVFRELRLEALRLNPRAFVPTFADERGRPRGYFQFMINSNVVLGMFNGGTGGTLIGCAILTPYPEPQIQHKGTVAGVYMTPEYRNMDLAKRMLMHLFEIAKTMGLRYVVSGIFASNTAAMRGQKAVGYTEMYREKDGVRYSDGSFDDIVHFVRYL